MNQGPKILQIGFNKCGTMSLFRFFERNGIPSIHWDGDRLMERIDQRLSRGEDPFADYPDVVFFSDFGTQRFRQIFERYPDAYYILNTRNPLDWLRSRRRHQQGAMFRQQMKQFGLSSERELLDKWLRDWYEHHALVLKTFAKGGRLLYFDIDRHGGAELAEFVAEHYKVDPSLYGHEHRTSDWRTQLRWLKERAVAGLRSALRPKAPERAG